MHARRSVAVPLGLMITALSATGSARAQSAAGPQPLGDVEFATSCPQSVAARFNHAVALLHHMTYPIARAEFVAIGEEQPTCAMAHWGIAMTLFHPLWPARPNTEELQRGWREVSRAREIGGTTPRESMFIDAAAAFFDPARTDYWDRIRHWEDAQRALYEAFQDDDAAAFFALSHLATAPASADVSHQAEAAAILAGILRARPMHPGASHYLIHANDAAGREHESLDVVHRYAAIAPRNPHALHMPTHIFVRLGEWGNVIAGNLRAADAALESPAGDEGQWVWDEFPHAIEYLVYAYLQIGDDSSALAQMQRLQRTRSLQPGFKTAFHLSSIPARYALERRDWKAASTLEPRPDPALDWDRLPWPEAITWFARGMGAARTGDTAGARAAESRLVVLRGVAEGMGEELFTRQTEVLRLGVSAWLARAERRDDAAVDLMRRAVALETSTPKHAVTPAPTLPANEMLGDLLLELNRSAEALEAYETSLRSAPGRFNSHAGAARAARRAGDDVAALRHYRALLAQASPGSKRPELVEAAAFAKR